MSHSFAELVSWSKLFSCVMVTVEEVLAQTMVSVREEITKPNILKEK